MVGPFEHILAIIINMHHTKMMYVGASMEVNISHRSRQDILTTTDLAHPDLFRNALNEIIQLMKMVSIAK